LEFGVYMKNDKGPARKLTFDKEVNQEAKTSSGRNPEESIRIQKRPGSTYDTLNTRFNNEDSGEESSEIDIEQVAPQGGSQGETIANNNNNQAATNNNNNNNQVNADRLIGNAGEPENEPIGNAGEPEPTKKLKGAKRLFEDTKDITVKRTKSSEDLKGRPDDSESEEDLDSSPDRRL